MQILNEQLALEKPHSNFDDAGLDVEAVAVRPLKNCLQKLKRAHDDPGL